MRSPYPVVSELLRFIRALVVVPSIEPEGEDAGLSGTGSPGIKHTYNMYITI